MGCGHWSTGGPGGGVNVGKGTWRVVSRAVDNPAGEGGGVKSRGFCQVNKSMARERFNRYLAGIVSIFAK